MSTQDPRWTDGSFLESLYQEFSKKVTGQHSDDLQRLINFLRSEGMDGKLALLCTIPHKEWMLIRMNGRGQPITELNERFVDINVAERAIFRRRVEYRLGYTISAPADEQGIV